MLQNARKYALPDTIKKIKKNKLKPMRQQIIRDVDEKPVIRRKRLTKITKKEDKSARKAEKMLFSRNSAKRQKKLQKQLARNKYAGNSAPTPVNNNYRGPSKHQSVQEMLETVPLSNHAKASAMEDVLQGRGINGYAPIAQRTDLSKEERLRQDLIKRRQEFERIMEERKRDYNKHVKETEEISSRMASLMSQTSMITSGDYPVIGKQKRVQVEEVSATEALNTRMIDQGAQLLQQTRPMETVQITKPVKTRLSDEAITRMNRAQALRKARQVRKDKIKSAKTSQAKY